MQAYLYNIISEQQLKEILECLYSCLNLPIQALDEAGNTLCGFGTATPFCMQFKKLLSEQSAQKGSCKELHANGPWIWGRPTSFPVMLILIISYFHW